MAILSPKRRNELCLFIFPMLLCLGTDSLAAGDIKFEGEVTSGVEVVEFKNGKSTTEAELSLETDRKEGVKAVLEFEVSNVDTELELEEIYIDKKQESGSNIILGVTKKILGLEYEQSDNKRLPISRTLIYRKLDTFAYVGKETTLRYESDQESGTYYTLSAGYAASLDYNIMGLVQTEISSNLSFLWTGLVQSDKITNGRQMVWATTFSLLLDSEASTLESELIGGQDPFESDFEKTFGDGRKVIFAGAKFLYGLKLGDNDQYRPFFSYSNVRHDLKYVRYYSDEYLFGLEFNATKMLSFAGNLNLVSSNSRIDHKRRYWNDSSVTLNAKLRF
jgi:hypothetical protein